MNQNEIIGTIITETVDAKFHLRQIDGLLKSMGTLASLMTRMKTHILIHHSWTKDSGTLSWPVIRKNHTEINGFKDIGYQFGIERYEDHIEILVGRMIDEEGAHCHESNMNRRSIGIMFTGNFDLAPPPADMFFIGIRLVASLCAFGGITPAHVQGHNIYATYKTCPGKMFSMDAFREGVGQCLLQ